MNGSDHARRQTPARTGRRPSGGPGDSRPFTLIELLAAPAVVPRRNALGTKASSTRVFTLIELLVVIAIIAIMLSLLLPALRGVKLKGLEISCLGRNRQLLVGLNMLVDDLQGLYPSVHNANYPPVGERYDPTGQNTAGIWSLHVKDYMGSPQPWGFQNWATTLLVDQESWHLCPLQAVSKTGQDWIAYNAFFGYRPQGITNSRQLHHVRVMSHQVVRPAATFVFADQEDLWPGTELEGYKRQVQPVYPHWSWPVAYRHHGGRAVYGFPDGHAAAINALEAVQLAVDDWNYYNDPARRTWFGMPKNP